ncbi:MAG: tRNA pseudouridine(55) synthase TruB [Chitinophagales bacterium]
MSEFTKNVYDKNMWEGSMLLVDKPKTWTSFDVVNKIRYALKLPKKKLKVGHAGTLDPLATGLLIICTGKFTKKINELQGLDKVYDGIIQLGAITPSYDAETEIETTFDTSHISREAILSCAKSFIGQQEQIPPIHSAVKIDGQRAYKLAREGQEVKMKTRSIELYDFKILNVEMPDVSFEVHCSKGTYIRSLAYDFGKRLDNGGYLKALRRTKIGEYSLDNAWNLEELIEHIGQQKEVLFGK